MALDNKYRVHEVAKDFGVSTREITEILTKYRTEPKNHMQVLDDADLSVIFEYMTQHHQVKNMESLLGAQQSERKEQPAAKQEEKPAEKASEQTSASSKVKQVHRIDTRGTGDVNLAKYDDHVDKLVDAKAERMESKGPKKQKLTKKSDQRSKPFGNKRRQEEQEKMRRLQRQQQMAALKKIPVKVMIPDEISVGELASRMKRTAADVIKGLIKLGVMASISEVIDYDTAAIVAEEMGCKVEKEVHVTIEEQLFDEHEDKAEELQPRDPVVVVMGHVDHGKTSLLDAIRKTKVTAGEAGGITQHIGAYRVKINGKPITFLDTPGHAAFTSMRARGAQVTDIAILVVAADDGIMPQTIEAINHAKAAGVPIIVAVNKIDKPARKPGPRAPAADRVRTRTGGVGRRHHRAAISPPRFGQGIDNLLEMVLLTAEVLDLKANPNRKAHGTVIEAKLDKGRGPVATLLVQNGTLHAGDTVIAGTSVGRVRAMTNDDGKKIRAGRPVCSGRDHRSGRGSGRGRYLRRRRRREAWRASWSSSVRTRRRKSSYKRVPQGNARQPVRLHLSEGEMKELQHHRQGRRTGLGRGGSSSRWRSSRTMRCASSVIHGAVGAINESDVMLAAASGAIIVGFNVRPDRTRDATPPHSRAM